MKRALRALVIEDSEFDALLLVNLLRLGQFAVEWRRVDTAQGMREALADHPWDIVFSDHQMPEFSAPMALDILQSTRLDLPFVIVSGGIGEETAVALMKAGAHDFLMKGQLGRLVPAVERELREAENRRARQQAEQSLRESEMRYRLLWENSPDAILMMDEGGRIVFVNPAAEMMFGYPSTELVGQQLSILLCGAPIPVPESPRSSADANAGRMVEMICRHRSGDELVAEIGFCRLEMQGQPWRVAIIRDITARRRAEVALRAKEEEFRVAREIQQRLFPKSAPELAGYDIAGSSCPADEAGGDYFDFLPMLNGGLGIVAGDVSGHGMGPALIMAETRAYLRMGGRNRLLPSDVLSRANRVLSDDLGDTDRFVTVLLIRLDPEARTLTYANAGHPPAFLVDSHGGVRHRLIRNAAAMGFTADASFVDAPPILLEPGDALLVVTDGVPEAEGPDGECFGAERTLQVLRANLDRPAAEIVQAVHAAVRAFVRRGAPHDDVTVIVMKVLPS